MGGAGDVLLHLVVEHGDDGHEAEGEDEVGHGAGEGDEHALPARDDWRTQPGSLEGGASEGAPVISPDILT